MIMKGKPLVSNEIFSLLVIKSGPAWPVFSVMIEFSQLNVGLVQEKLLNEQQALVFSLVTVTTLYFYPSLTRVMYKYCIPPLLFSSILIRRTQFYSNFSSCLMTIYDMRHVVFLYLSFCLKMSHNLFL